MLTTQPIKLFRYNRYQSNKYNIIVDVTQKLFQTIPPTPKTDQLMEYIKITDEKINLSTRFDLDDLQKLEIKKYYSDRRLAICSKIILPLSFGIYYIGSEETFYCMIIFLGYYWTQLWINYFYENDIAKICKNLANIYNKTE